MIGDMTGDIGEDIGMDRSVVMSLATGITGETPPGTLSWDNERDREYRRTHPWITFTVDLNRVPYRSWMLLGEASSKCQHIAGVPLRPATANSLHVLYLAKAARATTSIEGNTLSEEEVSQLIRGTLNLPPSREYLGKEVDNIIAECNSILARLGTGDEPAITPDRIKELNSKVLEGLDFEPGVESGKVRAYSVGVAKYRGAPAQDCDYLLARLCDWLNSSDFDRENELGLMGGPILKAVLAHLYLAWIHAFGNGNGRTARLVEFQILVSSGVPSPAAHLLSNHYNETRSEYYRQLDNASRVEGHPTEFLLYALQGFVDGLHSQLALIQSQQWQVAWENYVHTVFHDRNSVADTRRRHLVLDLSQRDEPVPRSELRALTPRIAEEYAGKTSKTLTRDINALLRLNLIERTSKGIIANKKMILAFLPLSGPASQETTAAQLPLPLE